MSATSETKTFGKGKRTVPANKAQKWYPTEDDNQLKKVSLRNSRLPYSIALLDLRARVMKGADAKKARLSRSSSRSERCYLNVLFAHTFCDDM